MKIIVCAGLGGLIGDNLSKSCSPCVNTCRRSLVHSALRDGNVTFDVIKARAKPTSATYLSAYLPISKSPSLALSAYISNTRDWRRLDARRIFLLSLGVMRKKHRISLSARATRFAVSRNTRFYTYELGARPRERRGVEDLHGTLCERWTSNISSASERRTLSRFLLVFLGWAKNITRNLKVCAKEGKHVGTRWSFLRRERRSSF